ncbi:MAG: DUF616 domain-containing protein [Bacteroidales bacterium]|jgi:hypothetical protein|nr:DUF616 domain-containing protein [Bacteroidales bacterium]
MRNNKVIYTCLVGEYDILRQPRFIYENFDYICFSNDIPVSCIGVWKIQKIPYKHPDKTRVSRYVKINPHTVLYSYKYSLWIDANVEIVNKDLQNRIEELIELNSKIAQVQHIERDCIYDEITECFKCSKDNVLLLYKQYKFLRKEGYPAHYGLFENNIIYRQHNDSLVVKISEEWWKMYMKFSKRDQLSLCYIYRKLDFAPDLLLPERINTRNCRGLKLYNHPPISAGKRIILRLKRICKVLLLYVLRRCL